MDASAAAKAARRAMTVGDLTKQIRALLEDQVGRVWVEGEISNFKRQPSGHWYFRLKDENAAIDAAMFRNKNRWVKDFDVKDGLRVVVSGKVTVYEPRGADQIVVERIEQVGFGALQAKFETVKSKLSGEGLFDQARKKPLPYLPTRIGIVTSKTSAALQDVLKVLHRRRPSSHITVASVRVQGPGAAAEVAGAVRRFSQADDVDVIIVARGGGSLEDLWAFNEEVVARSIAACRIPVVSAVGHETDFTMADFAADVRAPTPSAAAEVIVRDPEEQLRAAAQMLEQRLLDGMRRVLERRAERTDRLHERLRDPRRILEDFRERIEAYLDRASRAQRARLEQSRHRTEGLDRTLMAHHPETRIAANRERVETSWKRLHLVAARMSDTRRAQLEPLAAALSAISPLNVLARGYAIVRDETGRVVRASSEVRPGQLLKVRVHDGELDVVARTRETDFDDDGQGSLL